VPTGRLRIPEPEPEPEPEPILDAIESDIEEGEGDEEPKKGEKKKKSKPKPRINEFIKPANINFIDANGQFHENANKSEVLASFDKAKFTLVEVNARTNTCRLFTTVEFKEHLKKIEESELTRTPKEIQFTWNIGEYDLKYRMDRAIKAMSRGGRCSLIIGARNPKLVRTKLEREEMLTAIRETLRPHGYEWREMTGGFPNAELWFQGYSQSRKAKQSGVQKELAETPVADTVKPIDAKILGNDDDFISREVFQTSRTKFKDKAERSALRQKAERAFEKTQVPTDTKSSSSYWEQYATPTSQERPSSIPSHLSEMTKTMPGSAPKELSDAEAAAARRAELNRSPNRAKQEIQKETQEKLRSVAAQFSKLGAKKSLFGAKLAGR
jgi:translation initiation factor IF-3